MLDYKCRYSMVRFYSSESVLTKARTQVNRAERKFTEFISICIIDAFDDRPTCKKKILKGLISYDKFLKP